MPYLKIAMHQKIPKISTFFLQNVSNITSLKWSSVNKKMFYKFWLQVNLWQKSNKLKFVNTKVW